MLTDHQQQHKTQQTLGNITLLPMAHNEAGAVPIAVLGTAQQRQLAPQRDSKHKSKQPSTTDCANASVPSNIGCRCNRAVQAKRVIPRSRISKSSHMGEPLIINQLPMIAVQKDCSPEGIAIGNMALHHNMTYSPSPPVYFTRALQCILVASKEI